MCVYVFVRGDFHYIKLLCFLQRLKSVLREWTTCRLYVVRDTILFQSDADSSTIVPRGVETVGHSTVLPGETENILSSLHVAKRNENLTGFSTKLEHRAFDIEKHFPDYYPRGT